MPDQASQINLCVRASSLGKRIVFMPSWLNSYVLRMPSNLKRRTLDGLAVSFWKQMESTSHLSSKLANPRHKSMTNALASCCSRCVLFFPTDDGSLPGSVFLRLLSGELACYLKWHTVYLSKYMNFSNFCSLKGSFGSLRFPQYLFVSNPWII